MRVRLDDEPVPTASGVPKRCYIVTVVLAATAVELPLSMSGVGAVLVHIRSNPLKAYGLQRWFASDSGGVGVLAVTIEGVLVVVVASSRDR